MSGGLLALSRRWWEETGGYDTKMVAWGGENIDQSLRSWLCGGRIPGWVLSGFWRTFFFFPDLMIYESLSMGNNRKA